TDAHLVGLARRDREPAEDAERPHAERVRALGGHEERDRRAVRELAGVPSRHRAALLERRRKLREALEGGVGSIALVAIDGGLFCRGRPRDLVRDLHRHRYGKDLVGELRRALGLSGPLLRDEREFVLAI